LKKSEARFVRGCLAVHDVQLKTRVPPHRLHGSSFEESLVSNNGFFVLLLGANGKQEHGLTLRAAEGYAWRCPSSCTPPSKVERHKEETPLMMHSTNTLLLL
jgi:hypothetical protein